MYYLPINRYFFDLKFRLVLTESIHRATLLISCYGLHGTSKDFQYQLIKLSQFLKKDGLNPFGKIF